jgi:hypothetical protein
MQWPGSLCDSKKGCCFQDTGKPAPEFGIHGLWPQYATCRLAAAGDDGAASAFNILGSSSTAAGKTKKKCWPEDCGDKKDKLDLLCRSRTCWRRWSGTGRRCRARTAPPTWTSGATSGRC